MVGAGPETEIRVEYVYDIHDVADEVLDSYRRHRIHRDQLAAQLKAANEDLGVTARAAVSALRAACPYATAPLCWNSRSPGWSRSAPEPVRGSHVIDPGRAV
jgi:hypothetical protein